MSTENETNGKASKKDKRRLSSLERVIEQAMGENRSVGRPDDPAAQQWPELWKWLSTIYVGRDKMKSPATLTITLQPDGVAAKIVDKDMGCTVNVACAHLTNILQECETALNRDDLPVTIWGKKEPTLRTRRKRD